jgi:hypothetical protein
LRCDFSEIPNESHCYSNENIYENEGDRATGCLLQMALISSCFTSALTAAEHQVVAPGHVSIADGVLRLVLRDVVKRAGGYGFESFDVDVMASSIIISFSIRGFRQRRLLRSRPGQGEPVGGNARHGHSQDDATAPP